VKGISSIYAWIRLANRNGNFAKIVDILRQRRMPTSFSTNFDTALLQAAAIYVGFVVLLADGF
jgi:hypothetical protein